MRECLRKRLAAAEAVIAPAGIDFESMSLDELRQFVDAEMRHFVAKMGSVDAVIAAFRQEFPDAAEALAKDADRYR